MASPVPNSIKPGEVRNPKGINQYSYRKNAEETFERLLRSTAERGDSTISEAIIHDLLAMSQERDKWAIDKVLERILPAVQKHEVELPGVGPDALASALDRFQPEAEGEVSPKPNGNGAA